MSVKKAADGLRLYPNNWGIVWKNDNETVGDWDSGSVLVYFTRHHAREALKKMDMPSRFKIVRVSLKVGKAV